MPEEPLLTSLQAVFQRVSIWTVRWNGVCVLSIKENQKSYYLWSFLLPVIKDDYTQRS